jgi:hypothetical protein
MKFFIAEFYSSSHNDWLTMSYHKTFKGAIKALEIEGRKLTEDDFPPLAKHHQCFGKPYSGMRIWECEIDE